jgi:hypothetical protein
MGLIIVLTIVVGTWRTTSPVRAQYVDPFYDAPYGDMVGLEEAVLRLYQGAPAVDFYAQVARFDTAANAGSGLETLNTWILEVFAASGTPATFEPVEVTSSVAGVRAWFETLDLGPGNDPYAELALVQAQDDIYVYTVVVFNYYSTDSPALNGVAMDVAVAMIEELAATPPGQATPAAVPGEAPTSGLWAKLPAEEDTVPQRYGITYTEDRVNYAPEPLPEVVVATYGDVEGVETVVARNYGVPDSESGEVEDVPVAYIEVAVFEDAAQAAPGFATAATEQLVVLGLDGAGLEETEAGFSADEAVAYAAEVEGEEGTFSVAVTVARSGSRIVTVAAITTSDEDALALADSLAQAVIEAKAGEETATFSDEGTSTGGVWEMFPVTGDDVLAGMEPVDDRQMYPEPDA